ncbi:S8 family serine peptidase [Leucobacter albus]|uniref:S8 family serine peptidase n=1 Tax=Leucobacter albus TaxID=272210 RepID=A0ABW3TT53_9MICO
MARSVVSMVAGGVLLGAAVLGGVVSGGSPAQAASLTEEERVAGLWYADRLGFDELQAQGATGAGVKIAVIDVAINPDIPELAGANITVKGGYCAYPETGKTVPAVSDDPERASHGTDVVAMLVGNGVAGDGGPGTRGIAPEAEVWFYATGMPGEEATDETAGCEKYDASRGVFYEDTDAEYLSDDYFLGSAGAYAAWNAVRDGADIVVYSNVGDDISGWATALTEGLRSGVPFVVGTHNPDGDIESQLLRRFPFVLNGVVSVSGVDFEGNLLNGGGITAGIDGEAEGSNNLGFLSAGSSVLTPSSTDGWEPKNSFGTSLATPLVAGTLALGLQKFPEATANQVLHAMIRTTGADGLHEPRWSGKQLGYGIAMPLSLIEIDPTSFPDENPFFVMSPDDPRCLDPGDTSAAAPTSMEKCAWAAYPTSDVVWPSGPEVPGGTTEVGQAKAPGWVPIAIVGGAVLIAGLIATAIVVPIAVSRSRKRAAGVVSRGRVSDGA